jgi:ABC-type multidrug transport system ATPase subunit
MSLSEDARNGSPIVVSLQGVSRRFGDSEVLHDLDLEAEAGTIVSILGRNGSGKTTLLRILAGVLEPTSGSVSVFGRRPGAGFASFVPSGDRMMNWRLTGSENLRFLARLAGVPELAIAERIDLASHVVEARDLLSRRVGDCSMGQRRRLMLASAFASGAPVALLDEPYADLDDEGVSAVNTAIARWADGGGLVIYGSPVASGGMADARFNLTDGRLVPE